MKRSHEATGQECRRLRRAKLTDRARAGKEDAQLLFTRHAIERLLYRLAQSKHRDTFVLKGAMLFSLWAKVPYRSTGDLDLLAFGLSAPDHIAGVFRDICNETVTDDGVTFDASSVKAEIARPEDEYAGVRVTMNATLANARLKIKLILDLATSSRRRRKPSLTRRCSNFRRRI